MSQRDYFIARFFKTCSNTNDLKDLSAQTSKNMLKNQKIDFYWFLNFLLWFFHHKWSYFSWLILFLMKNYISGLSEANPRSVAMILIKKQKNLSLSFPFKGCTTHKSIDIRLWTVFSQILGFFHGKLILTLPLPTITFYFWTPIGNSGFLSASPV